MPSVSPDVTLERLLAALADRHDLRAWMVIRRAETSSSSWSRMATPRWSRRGCASRARHRLRTDGARRGYARRKGRTMDCETVREALSECDGKTPRDRRVRPSRGVLGMPRFPGLDQAPAYGARGVRAAARAGRGGRDSRYLTTQPCGHGRPPRRRSRRARDGRRRPAGRREHSRCASPTSRWGCRRRPARPARRVVSRPPAPSSSSGTTGGGTTWSSGGSIASASSGASPLP